MRNRNETISDIIDKRRPLVQKIERTEENLRELTSGLHALESQRNKLVTQIEDRKIQGRLAEIDFLALHLKIATELEALAKLKIRFSRDTLNIGVVGRARQGKSRLLQSLTGLTTTEIPDGDRQHCTGVRSTIHHNPNVTTFGEVYFHSERSFIDEVIAPYYEKLHLGAKPNNLVEFASKPLPPLPENLPGYAAPGAMYEHLNRYHTNIDKYVGLLNSPPKRISSNEIREYVAQDTADGQRIFFNYLAVKEVKITCPFPNTDVGQIALVDMPGLGDTGVGDETRLIQTLSQDIDAVLFVRMPSAKGDYWADVDVRLYDTARAAIVDLPLDLWSFMILNQTNANSANGNNFNNCQDLADDLDKKHLNLVDCIIANCADVEVANLKILDTVLNYLATKIQSLDRQYASSCQERMIELQNTVNTEIEKARQALASPTANQNEMGVFLPLYNQFISNLSVGLMELLDNFKQQRYLVDEDFFQPQVEVAIQACKEDAGIPDLQEIKVRHREKGSWEIVYAEYLHKIRTHLTRHFNSLDNGLKQLIDAAKSQITKVLTSQGSLGGLTTARGANFLQVIANKKVSDEQINLRRAFQNLWNFEMSYEVNFHYRIRQHLDDLTPDDTSLRLSAKPTAEEVLENLTQLHQETVYKCQEALADLSSEPKLAVFAAVEEFVDQVLRGEEIKNEWPVFLYEVRSQVWPTYFKPMGEGSNSLKEWQRLVDIVGKANQLEFLQFIN
ncbi:MULTISPECIES: hypothetical protein [unclassified Okeania]|uniref:hypothetical protein n=1 Tax=unclassified Okeania TaxID=2634635 RepID=UPI0013B7CE85|nr:MULTISPECIES: hypothetical protein [unclassified Okeania]NES79286.1 hypothetical protein [Okeania sp. SIO1H4]NET12606.1 hypothetical protein [Okeania sp. SIO1H6]NET22991.1 hypothetical protein [Okeania sp. SIO1H5]NET96423.1 hypothetical protein [Okeania sp. SIO1H2]